MALEQRQYLRSGELIVGPKVTFSNGLVEPAVSRIFRTRLNFNIEKTDGGEANKGKISIYNLNQDSRNFIEKENTIAILRVGYAENLSTLFFGDLAPNGVSVKRSGPDIITTLEVGDSEKILREAHIDIGLAANATNQQILNLALAKLNLTIGFQSGFKTVVYKHGFSFSGRVSNLLDQITKQVGVKWSIQDGEFIILPPKTTEPGEIIRLAPDSGLIGTPTKTKDAFKFQALLNPLIRPGKKIFVDSRLALGELGATVKIAKCKYNGDTHEGKWIVSCEGLIL